MLQTQYPTSSKGGLYKKNKAPLTKDAVQKSTTRLFMGRPMNILTPTHGRLPTPLLQLSPENLQQKIVQEHTSLYNTLIEHDFHITYMDTDLFCNRFVSIHHPEETGHSHSFGILYSCKEEPMNETILLFIQSQYKDFIYYDMRNEDPWAYLEGLDSIVLDRSTKTIYAYLSSKTYYWKLLQLHTSLGYNIQLLGYSGKEDRFPYTSDIMSVGETWAVICTEVLGDYYKKTVIEHLQKTKKVVELSTLQLRNKCSGVIELRNKQGKKYTLMSSHAYSHFTPEQKDSFQNILHVPIDTIEALGGSLRRCILEI